MLAQKLGADVDAMVIDLSNVVEPETHSGTKKSEETSRRQGRR